MNRVVHFDISVDEPQRAITFYRDAFGWSIEKWDGPIDYWLVKTGNGEPGIDGGIAQRKENETTIVTIGVTSIDDALDKIENAGGTVIQPKTSVRKVGYVAYCRDTEGNIFAIMEEDASAP
ncbi:MAG: VOC family protein [candidate division WOR-3 bacterium]|nr:MAG: VOC family protein [candidate division WOR-3 bacterium]